MALLLAAALLAALPGPAAAAPSAEPPLEKELKALAKEVSRFRPSAPRREPLSAAERASIEKEASTPLVEVRVGEVGREHSEGLRSFLAKVDLRAAPVRKIALGYHDCEAVDSRAARGIPYLVKTFDAEVGYAGDWLYVPAELSSAEEVEKVLRYLHAMSLRTMSEMSARGKGGVESWEEKLTSLARSFPKMRIYDVYHFSRKARRLVHAGLSTFLTGDPDPVAGSGDLDEDEGGGIRRGRPLAPGHAEAGTAQASRGGPEEGEGDLCYADFDLESACIDSAAPGGVDDCLVTLSERINCVCYGDCVAASAGREGQERPVSPP